eukprot:115642-Prorocentrum_minimum.AAC.3
MFNPLKKYNILNRVAKRTHLMSRSLVFPKDTLQRDATCDAGEDIFADIVGEVLNKTLVGLTIGRRCSYCRSPHLRSSVGHATWLPKERRGRVASRMCYGATSCLHLKALPRQRSSDRTYERGHRG